MAVKRPSREYTGEGKTLEEAIRNTHTPPKSKKPATTDYELPPGLNYQEVVTEHQLPPGTNNTMKCAPRREGDEFYCPSCGKRWAVDEPPPKNCDQSSSSKTTSPKN